MTQQTNSEPTTVESSGFTDFILHRLHVAELRTELTLNEIQHRQAVGINWPERLTSIKVPLRGRGTSRSKPQL